MKKTKNHPGSPGSFPGLLGMAFVFCALMFVLLTMANNVTYRSGDPRLTLLDPEEVYRTEETPKADTLLIYEDDTMGATGLTEMSAILSQMKAAFDTAECGEAQSLSLGGYGNLVLSVTHYQNLGSLLGCLKDWVKDGGNLMVLYPPDYSASFETLFGLLGIRECSPGNAFVGALRFSPGFLLGGDDRDFPIPEGYESAMSVYLENDCQVFAQTTGRYPTPILWRRTLGKGTVVVDNLGILEKGFRGFHCSAFSLLDSFCIYPVINAAAFYIDDFPSPVPEGYDPYLDRDFSLSIRDFYTSRWWPDIYNLGKAYGIRYTGLVIEEYSDRVTPPFERNGNDERFRYFGNMLLDAGGEIGLHGFNHMPLVTQAFDYEGMYDSYNQWRSEKDMEKSLDELQSFCFSLYPDQDFSVYVPPSNIISPEGIALLAEKFPSIKTIASVYIPGDLAYAQEFCVEENGIISTPRVISGYLMNDYVRLIALSELNFHLISSHFQHPDDVLDEDRGAELGWTKMIENLTDYVNWLYTSVPAIRSLTGTETAAAVSRYDYVQMLPTKKENGLTLSLSGFADEAWFLLRLNDGQEIAAVSGGETEMLTPALCLVQALDDTVDITFS